MNQWPICYDELAPSLRTGDLYLARGTVAISRAIETLTLSEWSHSGMVIRTRDLTGEDDPAHPILLWESTRDTSEPDYLDHHGKIGPMLVDLRARIEGDLAGDDYHHFAFRHLHVDEAARGRMIEGLLEVIHRVHSGVFPKNLQFVREFFEGRFEGREAPDDNFFCSELVAETWMGMGVLTRAYPRNAYTPKAFSEQGRLSLLQRAFLGPEVYIGAVSELR